MSFETDYLRIAKKHFSQDEYFAQDKIELFEKLSAMLVEYNEKVNLTAVTDTPGIIAKHIVDSLMISPYIPKGAKLCDVGCGGGFPTLPLAIMRPDLTITAVDSTAKKLAFVEYAASELGLNNVNIRACRAEELGQSPEFRESFDAVCARAVARMNLLCELCIPLIKKGGVFVCSKGSAGREEHLEAKKAIAMLGAETVKEVEATLYADDGDQKRFIYTVKKIKHTDKAYPRAYARMTKKPL